MKNYVLDTNILIHIANISETWEKINEQFDPFANNSYLSFATVAEAESFSKRLKWGKGKVSILEGVTRSFKVIHSSDELIQHYVEIDVFSQGKHPALKLPKGMSARNMGKNDIWIAATAKSIEGAELITTDRDFEHLDGVWFGVNYVEIF
ncbi:MAG: type II toxin-antitoxin system VapC family toxin [Chitinophagales bacterium]